VDFGDTIVREVMTPRPEMVAIRREASLQELTSLFEEEKYSRVPVYEHDLDHIVGLVFAIDFLGQRSAGYDSPIEPIIRKVRFVPETKKVSEMLREFQRSRSTMAIVVDEYGGTSGLVTVEDVLEEIVGDIRDEFDEVDQEIVEEGEGRFLVSGKADIDDLKDKFQLEVNGKGFETVSGFLLDSLGRVPQAGEVIDFDGMKIVVVDADGQRIHKVRFQFAQPK
jgi:CBS domain containing-hemolysin-like protein